MEQQVNLYQATRSTEKRLFSARAIGIALLMLTVCLGGLAGFARWHNARLERTLSSLEKQQSDDLALSERATASLKPSASLPELDAKAKQLSADIASRERALAIVQSGAANASSGFAARLEALARSQIEGLWLRRIVVAVGEGQLAFQGSTADPHLVPVYLAALANERALRGVNFDRLVVRRATAEEAPAQSVFEIGAPGITFAQQSTDK